MHNYNMIYTFKINQDVLTPESCLGNCKNAILRINSCANLTNSQAGTMKPPVLRQCILLRYVPLRDSCSESVPVVNC